MSAPNPFEPGTVEYDEWAEAMAGADARVAARSRAPKARATPVAHRETPATETCDHGVPVTYPCDECSAGAASPDAATRRHARVLAAAEDLRVRNEARRLVAAENAPPAVLPEILSLRARLARPRPPVRWRIKGLAPADARVVLAAQFKSGKTTMVGNLIRCLVDGDPFLGQHEVTRVDGAVVLLDFEMSEHQLDAWLADQKIANDDRVIVLPMRGHATSFDLRDPDTLERWAKLLRDMGAAYVVLDCLRPWMDALGLNEHTEAGTILTAYDALLVAAGVRESLVVHHMGHSGERARGDSRIRDWPEVEWRLVRETEDPASNRYLTAFGRDVDLPESRLNYDPHTRRLAIAGGSREDADVTKVIPSVLAWVESNAGCTQNSIEANVPGQKSVRKAVAKLVETGRLIREPGSNRSKKHYLPTQCVGCVTGASTHLRGCVGAYIDAPHTRPDVPGTARRTEVPPTGDGMTLREVDLFAAEPWDPWEGQEDAAPEPDDYQE